ncbi:AMP-binding protein, partial [Streptomyces fuscigenes]|uniref:AMP-binding protein n=1 Tax=Streptomyces fuscigenes TaxID=1528880 RepID=UPI003FD7214B
MDHRRLDAAAAAVAAGLRARGVRRGQAVALALPRSWRLVCAMLGVLRLGACVVPLDTLSPAHRRAHVLTDSGAVAVVHGGVPLPDLPPGIMPLAVDELLYHAAHEEPPRRTDTTGTPEPAPSVRDTAFGTASDGGGTDARRTPGAGDAEARTAPESDGTDARRTTEAGGGAAAGGASFLFYTSGTTGVPKGVEVRDAGILRLAEPGYLDLRPGDRYACLSNPAFDALSFEVWTPLLTGGCCVVLGDEEVRDPHRLAAALLRERVDTLFVTTALFNAVVDTVADCFAGARQVLIGGESLNPRTVRRWYRHNAASSTRLHNVYGPTESSTFALCHPIPRDAGDGPVPVGRPLPGTGMLLAVPGDTRPAPPGEVAELLLSGAGLAAGYRNLPEETRRRFVAVPAADGAPVRHYRTGDLVRAGSDGLVSYVGRVDRQVKVRGFRIEPGEVERQLLGHPALRQVHVCTRVPERGGPRELLAYLVTEDGLTHGEFEAHVAARLPHYMRPHHVYRLGALPLTANGKVDERALLSGDAAPWRAAEGPSVPVSARCREVLDLAGRVLGARDARPGDRWTSVGGDSLGALRLRFEARRRWGVDLPAALVLRSDFAAIADAVDARLAEAGSDARAGSGTGPGPGAVADGDASGHPAAAPPTGAASAPATCEQQRLWLLDRRDPDSGAYLVGQAFRLTGRVDAAALRHACAALVRRHVALRTGFEAAPEGLRQAVGPAYDPWCEPGPGQPADEEGALLFADRFFAERFDLAVPRMLRVCWLPFDDGGLLLLQLHHIAVDGWSLGVLFEDMSAAYAASTGAGGSAPAGAPEPLAAGPDPYTPLDGREPPGAGSGPYTPLDHALWQERWHATPAYRRRLEELLALYGDREGAAEPLRPGHPASTGRTDGTGTGPAGAGG